MTTNVTTRATPEPRELVAWLQHTRSQKGLRAAREALLPLHRRHPDNPAISELFDWHDACWWQPLRFGCISLERQAAEHFEFVWTLALDTDFSSKLVQFPGFPTPKELLEELTTNEQSLVPEINAIHWVVFKDGTPIGLAAIVNINFLHRVATLSIGVLPGHDRSMAVADAFCASLVFAFNCLGMNKMQSRVSTSNDHATQLQKRLGFTEEACLKQEVWAESDNRYQDLIALSMLRDEFATNKVLQRQVRRRHDPMLDQTRAWPRHPLRQLRV